MEKTDTPRNQDGQAPTRTSAETTERLEAKSDADRGRASKQRIAAKISTLKD